MFIKSCPMRSRTVAVTAAVMVIFGVAVAAAGPSCPADVDSDGEVGITDLLLVLQEWGQGSGTSDFTGVDHLPDGVVDLHDFLGVLAAWGPCPRALAG